MPQPSTAYLHPLSTYRIQPFWFWNGEMDDQEIARQIREMADKGLGGFFICARQGLEVPYLSESWFDKVRYAADLAAEHGLEVWLYDEYPYPSGIAGGEVLLAHPDAKHKLLSHRSLRVSGGNQADVQLPWGRILYAKAAPVRAEMGEPNWHAAVDVASFIGNLQPEQVFQKTGLTAYNNKRYFSYNPANWLRWQAPAGSGEWEVLVFVEEEVSDFKYYGTFVDPLHKDAMRTFIELTHQRYADALGDRLRRNVRGMFTDEIGVLGHIPWSPIIAGYVQEKYGTDLLAQLPLLIYNSGESAAKVRYQFYQAIHELLRDHYHLQVHEWCEQHELQYIAEVPSVRMSTQRYSHIPGLDSAHEKLGRSLEWILDRYAHSFRYNPKMMTSLARQLDRDRVLVECFHSVGWSMTLQDAKWMIDRLAALGVNMFNFHAFYYTADGLTKHDAPPSQFVQNPYWPHFRQLADYTARLSVLMSEGRMLTDLAIVHPTATIWAHMGNPFHEFRYCGEDQAEARHLQQFKDDWHSICKMLTWEQRDYDHLDTEVLHEAEVDSGRIRIGKANYGVLVIPPISCLEAEAWDAIRRFVESGGTVVAIGSLPYQIIDERTSIEEEVREWFDLERSPMQTYWSGVALEESMAVRIMERRIGQGRTFFIEAPCGLRNIEKEFARVIEQAAPRQIRLETTGEGSDRCFLMQHRELGDGTELVFISNQEGGSHTARLVYRGALSASGAELSAELMDFVTGEGKSIEVVLLDDNNVAISLDFAPYESHAVRLYREEAASEQSVDSVSPSRAVLTVDAQADWALTVERNNIIRLGEFELTVNDMMEEALMVQAKTFIDQASDLAGAGKRLPFRFDQTFGIPMEAKLDYPAACSYETCFIVESMPSLCKLLMERGAISGNYTIYINGYAITAEQFSPDFYYDYLNQSCSVLPYLIPGRNVLRVEVEVMHDWDGVVNPIYLAGDFGVESSIDGAGRMTTMPAVGQLVCSPQAGLPYYAGTITLQQLVHMETSPTEAEFELDWLNWDPDFHECAEVIVNGTSLGVCAWSPYRWTGSSALLQAGDNQIEVRITNTLIGILEGKRFDYAEHQLHDVYERGLNK